MERSVEHEWKRGNLGLPRLVTPLHGQGNPLVLLMAMREAPLANRILMIVELDVSWGFGPI